MSATLIPCAQRRVNNYYEIHSKISKVTKTYVYGLYIIAHQIPYIRICADAHFISYISSPLHGCDKPTICKGLISKIHNTFCAFYYFLFYVKLNNMKVLCTKNYSLQFFVFLCAPLYTKNVYEKTLQNLKFRSEARFENQIYIICALKGNMQ